MFEVAAGVLLALAIRNVGMAVVRYLWYRFAYDRPLWDHKTALFGRYHEGTVLPAPVAILRRVVEGHR